MPSKAPFREGWAFWRISAWDGKWTKYHWISTDGRTLCGRWPHPEDESLEHGLCYADSKTSVTERCRMCSRILAPAPSE